MRTFLRKLFGKAYHTDPQTEIDWQDTYAGWVKQCHSLDFGGIDTSDRYWNDIPPLPDGFQASDDELRVVLDGLFSVGQHLVENQPKDWPPSTVALRFSWRFMSRSEVVIYFDPECLPFERKAIATNEHATLIKGDPLHHQLGLNSPLGFDCEGYSFGSLPERFPSSKYDPAKLQSAIMCTVPDEQMWLYWETSAT